VSLATIVGKGSIMAATTSVSEIHAAKPAPAPVVKIKPGQSAVIVSFGHKLASAQKSHTTAVAKVAAKPATKPVMVTAVAKGAGAKAPAVKPQKADEQDLPEEDSQSDQQAHQQSHSDTEPETHDVTAEAETVNQPKPSVKKAVDPSEQPEPAAEIKDQHHPLSPPVDPDGKSSSRNPTGSGNGKSKDRPPASASKSTVSNAAPANATPPLAIEQPNAHVQPAVVHAGSTGASPSASANSVVKAVAADDSSKAETANSQDSGIQSDAEDATSAADAAPAQPTFGGDVGTGKLSASEGHSTGKSSASDISRAADPATANTDAANAALAQSIASSTGSITAGNSKPQGSDSSSAAASLNVTVTAAKELSASPGVKPAAPTAAAVQARFVEENHPKIVSSITGQLLPNGGKLQIRLDPPDMGSLQITVQMRNGAMTAEFQTSNDEATRVLSHSLGQLKSTLESAGMSVEKLHVEQTSKRSGESKSDSDSQKQSNEQDQKSQQEKQRREMMQRMWQKLSGDPLDMVA
jgi:flagellar hook-length control protein FliK